MSQIGHLIELPNEDPEYRKPVNYKQLDFEDGFTPALFVSECCMKLNAEPLTLATACVLLHKFFKEVEPSKHDCFLIATSTLYLAAKVRDDNIKLRDIITVAHHTLNGSESSMEDDDEYWSMRDAIIQAELLIMQVVKFEVSLTHPHKYMLHYLKVLEPLLGQDMVFNTSVARHAAAFLQDFHHDAQIINYKPQHIAVACISLALQCCNITLPQTSEIWYTKFVSDLEDESMQEIMDRVINAYIKKREA